MQQINISAILYQEDSVWIAQGLEYDISTQGRSLPDARKRFVMKLIAEVAISDDLGLQPLENIDEAPEEFWQMFAVSDLSIEVPSMPMRVKNKRLLANVIPHMKVGELIAVGPEDGRHWRG